MNITRQLEMCALLVIVSLVSTTFCSTVKAELMQADLVPGSGDGLLLRDTDSGLEWLRLTETQGLSVVDVIEDGIGGYADMGFDLASVEEVEALFLAGGVVELSTGFIEDNFQPVSLLINLLGCVQGCDGDLPAAQGWVQAPDLQDWVFYGVLQTAACCPPSGRAYVLDVSAAPKTTRSEVSGVFLVRDPGASGCRQRDLLGKWYVYASAIMRCKINVNSSGSIVSSMSSCSFRDETGRYNARGVTGKMSVSKGCLITGKMTVCEYGCVNLKITYGILGRDKNMVILETYAPAVDPTVTLRLVGAKK